MSFTTFLDAVFLNVWVIAVFAGGMLIAGWFVSRWMANLVVVVLKKIRSLLPFVGRLKTINPGRLESKLRNLARVSFLILTCFCVWLILGSQPDIASFFSTIWTNLVIFFQWPVVVFSLEILFLLILTVVVVRVYFWVRSRFLILTQRIRDKEHKNLKGWKFQKVQIFTAHQLAAFLLLISKVGRYAVNFLLLFLYLTSAFGIFPQTRGMVTNLFEVLFQFLGDIWKGFQSYLPHLLILVLIVLVTHFGLKLIRFLFGEVEKGSIKFPNFYPDWAMPTYQLVRFLVIALAFVAAFPFVPGSSSPVFQGISVFLGLLISLGSSSFISNIVSGVVLTYTRAFRIGDRVKIADTEGDIIEKRLLVTRIRTIKNVEITIPNGLVMSSHIINYSTKAKEHGLILHTTVTLGYDIPWRSIHAALIQAALATTDILKEPAPFVLQTSLDDFYVSYEINAYTEQAGKMASVYSELHQNIQDFCYKNGIEILSPHYASLRDGNSSAVPPEYLPKDYEGPTFNVRIKSSSKGR